MSHPNMPKDKIPYWDFDAKASSKTPRDASAAAVMASAYVELSTYVEDEALSGQFLSLAERYDSLPCLVPLHCGSRAPTVISY